MHARVCGDCEFCGVVRLSADGRVTLVCATKAVWRQRCWRQRYRALAFAGERLRWAQAYVREQLRCASETASATVVRLSADGRPHARMCDKGGVAAAAVAAANCSEL